MAQRELQAAERVALITGTSSGFGLLTAVKLAGMGYRVVATMRNASDKAALLEKAGQRGAASLIEVMQLDVTRHEQIERVVEEVAARYGTIDVLVNNAGFSVGGFVEEVPMDAWRQQMETNFFGLVAVTKAVLPIMRERRSGTIIQIGSVSGKIGFPGYAPYAASKYAVEGFSESLRHEMAPFGVKVVVVEPGAYRTPIWKKGLADIRTRPDSPYAPMLQAVLAYSRRAGETAPDPQEVADRIGKLVTLRSPRLRYALGQGSRLTLWAKALLPWAWFERAIGYALGRK
ncbi:SDR family oxidoreductase [Paenibacillus ginsengarvi]|uniref:SDR family oxidoreductase n=1 Tax=Paenibacillus ginsengarvi TaxID=400777 RepID=A0A3B0C8R6_9BACL|nr:SDR family oxidoreductase [Paenibacillus ginsengarvi]RKN79206.1 SDR family oxidoreductase [Paenibacillus ginsengarvi]